VDHPGVVHRLQGLCGLLDDRPCLRGAEDAGLGDAPGQGLTLDAGHDDVRRPGAVGQVGLAVVVHVGDAGVLQRSHRARLVAEPGLRGVVDQPVQQLHSDRATEDKVRRPPHLTHAPGGDGGIQAVAVVDEQPGSQHMVAIPSGLAGMRGGHSDRDLLAGNAEPDRVV
jgi:hypothetical protein